MNLPSPATWTHVVYVGLFWLFAISPPLFAQNWTIQTGSNITQYQFTNSSGTQLASIRPSSGRHLEIGYQKILLDTSKLLLKTNGAAVYFANHSRQAKLLSMLRLGINVSSNQFNALGNIGISQFAYQTEFVGIGLQGGFQLPFGKKIALEAMGKMNGHSLMQGNQVIDTQNLDLTKDAQFNGLQVLAGYLIQFNYRINSIVGLHLGYQSMQSIGVSAVNNTQLTFKPQSAFVGIRLFPN